MRISGDVPPKRTLYSVPCFGPRHHPQLRGRGRRRAYKEPQTKTFINFRRYYIDVLDRRGSRLGWGRPSFLPGPQFWLLIMIVYPLCFLRANFVYVPRCKLSSICCAVVFSGARQSTPSSGQPLPQKFSARTVPGRKTNLAEGRKTAQTPKMALSLLEA